MNIVSIQNSWQLDLIRIHKYRSTFKDYYYNHVVAEVFKQTNGNFNELLVFFNDNHFCNADNLDYRRLHKFLKKFFKIVSFVSDGLYDWVIDPEYFSPCTPIEYNLGIFIEKTIEISQNLDHRPNKMFGLHILRPDLHRLGILIEFSRQGLLEYTDVRLGFRSWEFGAPEYFRASNIDFTCLEFDISYKELFELIDSLSPGDRVNFRDNATYPGDLLVEQDIKKNYYRDYAIDIVCTSTINDNVGIADEKLLRPILLKQPFIPVASANYINAFTTIGNFKSYSELWDESWDSLTEINVVDKIKKISSTCKQIVSNYTIDSVVENSKSICEYNYDLLVAGKHTLPSLEEMVILCKNFVIKNENNN
jgi:hypothetical protein